MDSGRSRDGVVLDAARRSLVVGALSLLALALERTRGPARGVDRLAAGAAHRSARVAALSAPARRDGCGAGRRRHGAAAAPRRRLGVLSRRAPARPARIPARAGGIARALAGARGVGASARRDDGGAAGAPGAALPLSLRSRGTRRRRADRARHRRPRVGCGPRHGRPRHGPPGSSSEGSDAPLGLPRPTLVAPRGTRAAPRFPWPLSSARAEARAPIASPDRGSPAGLGRGAASRAGGAGAWGPCLLGTASDPAANL